MIQRTGIHVEWARVIRSRAAGTAQDDPAFRQHQHLIATAIAVRHRNVAQRRRIAIGGVVRAAHKTHRHRPRSRIAKTVLRIRNRKRKACSSGLCARITERKTRDGSGIDRNRSAGFGDTRTGVGDSDALPAFRLQGKLAPRKGVHAVVCACENVIRRQAGAGIAARPAYRAGVVRLRVSMYIECGYSYTTAECNSGGYRSRLSANGKRTQVGSNDGDACTPRSAARSAKRD